MNQKSCNDKDRPMVDSEIFASPKTGGCPLSLGQI
jgi:hypothetical protein